MNQHPLVPIVDDPDTGGFWAAARSGHLAVQRCRACREPIHLPKAYCSACGSWESEWETLAPTGTIHSWTIVERTIRSSFPAPYTVIVVELDEAPGVRLVGRLEGCADVAAGDPVVATFDEDDGEVVIPRWQTVR